LAGVAQLAILYDDNPADPSLNTATTRAPGNIGGATGALLADLLLQGFGLIGALPGLAIFGWAWRLWSGRGTRHTLVRFAALAAAMPLLAGVVGLLPIQTGFSWLALTGPGGTAGKLVANALGALGVATLGSIGEWAAYILAGGLGLGLALYAIGLSARDWRGAGHAAGRAAGAGYRGGRMVIGTTIQGGSAGVGSASSWLRQFVTRQPGLEESSGASQPGPDVTPPDRHMTIRQGWATGVEPRLDGGKPADPRPGGAKKDKKPGKRPTVEQMPLPLIEPGWNFPALGLLRHPPKRDDSRPSDEAMWANARLLETVLEDYGVKGRIIAYKYGPVVTLYELEPDPGIRSARVIGLADDVARSLSVVAVRIATVPGRNVIGIEVPNARRETVYLQEILASEAARNHQGRLPLALGQKIDGDPMVTDLARMPHLMIAGTTGSGKSVGVNAMILSLLYRLSPDQCRLILIDPKMLELNVYEGIPHLMAPVVTEPAKAVTALKWVVREMERRYRSMSQLNVRNIAGYNDRVAEARAKGEIVNRRVQTGFDPDTGRPMFEDLPLALEPLPFIVVIVDEMADLMMVAGKEIEAAVQRLAQMARAAGIHVIMATQRPSVDVITGTIKANFPTRISFQVISKFDSRTILGEQGAEQLLGQGDMLFMEGGGKITRVHGPFVSDDEIARVVDFLRAQGEPAYIEDVTEAVETDTEPALSGIAGASDSEKSLFDQAVAIVARDRKASTSYIQRSLNIGYNKAAKLVERMEREGVITPANHVGKREILVRDAKEDDY
jgi:S-DNA-T family DNA segregation ATPase FtsK/SpoIIIE